MNCRNAIGHVDVSRSIAVALDRCCTVLAVAQLSLTPYLNLNKMFNLINYVATIPREDLSDLLHSLETRVQLGVASLIRTCQDPAIFRRSAGCSGPGSVRIVLI